MRAIRLALLLVLLSACGCASVDSTQAAYDDPPAVREYPTGSNIIRRDRGVPASVKVYGKGYAEEMVQQSDQSPTPYPPKN